RQRQLLDERDDFDGHCTDERGPTGLHVFSLPGFCARRPPCCGCAACAVRYRRMPIEVESPEQLGYDTITNNLSESSVADRRLGDLGIGADLDDLLLCYGDHLGDPLLREAVAAGGDG